MIIWKDLEDKVAVAQQDIALTIESRARQYDEAGEDWLPQSLRYRVASALIQLGAMIDRDAATDLNQVEQD